MKNKETPAMIFVAFKNIIYKELANGGPVIFATENSRSFWRKIKEGLNNGIKETIHPGTQQGSTNESLQIRCVPDQENGDACDYGHSTISSNQVHNQALAEQSESDRKIIAEFGISKTKLHQTYIEQLDEISKNLQEVFGVNPEQLRLEADFKRRAQEDSFLPFKKDPDLSKPYRYRKGRRATKKNQSKRNDHGIFDTLG